MDVGLSTMTMGETTRDERQGKHQKPTHYPEQLKRELRKSYNVLKWKMKY